MKRPEYKTAKWEKMAAILIKTMDYYYDQLSSLKSEYLNVILMKSGIILFFHHVTEQLLKKNLY